MAVHSRDRLREQLLQVIHQGGGGRDFAATIARIGQPTRAVAWKDEPSTYFMCTEDLAIAAERQRMRAADGARLVDFPAGHHPFRSHSEAFAERTAAEFHPSTGHGSGAAGR